jgi:hypothetical protein
LNSVDWTCPGSRPHDYQSCAPRRCSSQHDHAELRAHDFSDHRRTRINTFQNSGSKPLRWIIGPGVFRTGPVVQPGILTLCQAEERSVRMGPSRLTERPRVQIPPGPPIWLPAITDLSSNPWNPFCNSVVERAAKASRNHVH